MRHRIKDIVAEVFSCDITNVEDHTSFQNELGSDSIEMVDVYAGINRIYHLKLNQKEFVKLDSINDIMEYLHKHLELSDAFIIDLVETDQKSLAISNWNMVSSILAKEPGFNSAQLLEVFDKIGATQEYVLSSITQWNSVNEAQQARLRFRSSPEASIIKSMQAKFEPTICSLYDQECRVQEAPDSCMVMVDVILLDVDTMLDYAAMWARACDYMKNKDGFLNVRLYKARDPKSSKYQFINIACWESYDKFICALKTPTFKNIVEEFKDNFSLYLCQVVNSVRHSDTCVNQTSMDKVA